MSNSFAISWREQVVFNDKMMSTLYYTNTLSWILIVLDNWNKSARRHEDTLGHTILIQNRLVFLLNAAYLATNTNIIVYKSTWTGFGSTINHTTNTNIIVYKSTWTGFGSTINRTCSKNANHHNTHAVKVVVFNVTFNNISVISWRSVLLVEETEVPRENHQTVASQWQTLSPNVVHLAMIEIRTHNISGVKSNYHMITATTAPWCK
jgi:hypothetical protein